MSSFFGKKAPHTQPHKLNKLASEGFFEAISEKNSDHIQLNIDKNISLSDDYKKIIKNYITNVTIAHIEEQIKPYIDGLGDSLAFNASIIVNKNSSGNGFNISSIYTFQDSKGKNSFSISSSFLAKEINKDSTLFLGVTEKENQCTVTFHDPKMDAEFTKNTSKAMPSVENKPKVSPSPAESIQSGDSAFSEHVARYEYSDDVKKGALLDLDRLFYSMEIPGLSEKEAIEIIRVIYKKNNIEFPEHLLKENKPVLALWYFNKEIKKEIDNVFFNIWVKLWTFNGIPPDPIRLKKAAQNLFESTKKVSDYISQKLNGLMNDEFLKIFEIAFKKLCATPGEIKTEIQKTTKAPKNKNIALAIPTMEKFEEDIRIVFKKHHDNVSVESYKNIIVLKKDEKYLIWVKDKNIIFELHPDEMDKIKKLFSDDEYQKLKEKIEKDKRELSFTDCLNELIILNKLNPFYTIKSERNCTNPAPIITESEKKDIRKTKETEKVNIFIIKNHPDVKIPPVIIPKPDPIHMKLDSLKNNFRDHFQSTITDEPSDEVHIWKKNSENESITMGDSQDPITITIKNDTDTPSTLSLSIESYSINQLKNNPSSSTWRNDAIKEFRDVYSRAILSSYLECAAKGFDDEGYSLELINLSIDGESELDTLKKQILAEQFIAFHECISTMDNKEGSPFQHYREDMFEFGSDIQKIINEIRLPSSSTPNAAPSDDNVRRAATITDESKKFITLIKNQKTNFDTYNNEVAEAKATLPKEQPPIRASQSTAVEQSPGILQSLLKSFRGTLGL